MDDFKQELYKHLRLLEHYTRNLQDLIDLYNAQRKRKMMVRLFDGFIFLFFIAIGLMCGTSIKMAGGFHFSHYIAAGIIMVIIVFAAVVTNYFASFFHQYKDDGCLKDEMIATENQLHKLIINCSQIDDHLLTSETDFLLKVDFDLKLTNAENVMRRIQRIAYLHPTYFKSNNDDSRNQKSKTN